MSDWAHAFSLSADEVRASRPPGTVQIIDAHTAEREAAVTEKYPQPSDSAADPLNWTNGRKYAILATVSFYTLTTDLIVGVVAPATPVMVHQFVPFVGFAKLSQLAPITTLMYGVSNIIWVPFANIFGRRLVMIVSLVLLALSTVWCGLAVGYDSLYAARAVQGFCAGPALTIAPIVIGEIFFVHEQGRAMAVYTSCLAGGPFLGGIIGSYIAAAYGYRFLFWIPLALVIACLVLVVFVVPETIFDRTRTLSATGMDNPPLSEGTDDKTSTVCLETIQTNHPLQGKFSYVQSLKIGTYRGDIAKRFAELLKPFLLPGAWVVSLHYGALVGGVVSLSIIGPQILASPPYLWGTNVGLVFIGGMIGAVLGAVFTYLGADFLFKRQAAKSRSGVTEPEARLPLMFPGVLMGATGIWTFGFSAASHSPHAWVGLCVGMGMLASAIAILPSVGFNYIIDSYGAFSVDCLVMTTITRAVVQFPLSYFVADWVLAAGPAVPFGVFGAIMAGVGLLAVPLWVFGKRMRIATASVVR